MRVEFLSDHVGTLLDEAKQQRRTVLDDEAAGWTGLYEAGAALESARRQKPLWRRALSLSSAEEKSASELLQQAQRQIDQSGARRQVADQQFQRTAAGARAENNLAAGLSSLSDQWILLRGYKNRGGETDSVLLGPKGLWAVEVKSSRGCLSVDGDRWTLEKLDKRGRVVEQKPAQDNGGRSWGRQVTEVAQGLAAWLDRNRCEVRVHTAVLVLNERATIGRCHQPGVDLIGTRPEHLLKAVDDRGAPIGSDQREKILELIRRDHRHHNTRRAKR